MRIDSHQHFWQYNPTDYIWMSEIHGVLKKDFLPEHLLPMLRLEQVDGTIAVQARQMVEETDFLLQLTQQHDWIKGVVGWIPLCNSNVEQYLEQYAQEQKIVGFRHVLHDEPDPYFMLRNSFHNGINALSRYSKCYDLLIFEHHLPQTIQFVDKHPNVKMIVDHIAKPRIGREMDDSWEKSINELAKRNHVFCKLSGMVTEVRENTWDAELLKPYFNIVLEAFGPQRLLFGSDWPVCLLQSNYSKWMNTVQAFIAPLSECEQEDIMGNNASKIYLQSI
jgi:L-fuconolactonase